MHPFPREMSLDSKLSAGYMVLNLIFALVEALTLPANIPLETYAVSIDGNAVTVEI
jgi:hypothetical protein